jgi:hypothetical protein
MGAGIVRTIGIVRARCKIGMTNLVYNIRRFIILERMAQVARRTGALTLHRRESGLTKSSPDCAGGGFK